MVIKRITNIMFLNNNNYKQKNPKYGPFALYRHCYQYEWEITNKKEQNTNKKEQNKHSKKNKK